MLDDVLSKTSLESWANWMYTSGLTLPLIWWIEIDRTFPPSLPPITQPQRTDRILSTVYGGKISEIPKDSSSFVNRDTFFTFQIYGSALSVTEKYPEGGVKSLTELADSIDSSPYGACTSLPFPSPLSTLLMVDV